MASFFRLLLRKEANMKKHTWWMLLGLGLLLVPLTLFHISCGGGGGSDSGGSSTINTETGSVAIFLTDDPADDYEHIYITITKVSLIPVHENGDGEPVVIYEFPNGYEVDLLSIRNDDHLLTMKKNIPAGLYSKIRLEISDIRPEPKNEVVGACSSFKLPSGKIDLNPREPFRVIPRTTLAIRLDIDANKSINVSGNCVFRPVVFVDILEVAQRCPQILKGTITSSGTDSQTKGFILALAHNRGELEVSLSQNPVIFDENGDFEDEQALKVGQEVRVRGSLNNSGVLEASVIVIGDVIDVKGVVDGPVNTQTNLFPFTPNLGEELVGQYDVLAVGGSTFILTNCDTVVGSGEIQTGVLARVIGKTVRANGKYVLRAVVILLRPAPSPPV